MLVVILVLVLVVAIPAVGAARITIPKAHYDARGNDNYRENLNDEYVVKNNTNRAVSLRGYKIHDEGRKYLSKFPVDLGREQGVTLHTDQGRNSATHFYRGRSYGAVWNNEGDTVTLRTAANRIGAKKGL